jgi:hypothetical protein
VGRYTALFACVACIVIPAVTAGSAADPGADPRSLKGGRVLGRTLMTADVDGDGDKEQVVLVNWVSGKKDVREAFDILLAIYRSPEDPGPPLWTRSVLEESGGPCHHGDLALADIEGNGASEIWVTYGASGREEAREKRGELYRWETGGARLIWAGVLERDNTRDPETPDSEKEMFKRQPDLAKTLGARGRSIFFEKTVRVAAGVELPTPRVIAESAPLPPRRDGIR